ncbi:hypothetical protein SAMN05660748_2140 [Blastococcus aggregatus]|uniref:Uncharacterized protein n=1 Tax=Blastococcus aggregatus TaxID=38502 RepID=A0A285V741_9ACTN|nr:hypothetical protein [Blastococcus aggregatus]SOC49418.1 hypothetical protein SAMN05660748_2140 [Blastococcus aggregatus]
MAFEEKRAWIMATVAVLTYAVYAVVVVSGAGDAPLPDAPYAAALLWSVGAAIAGTIALNVAADLSGRREDRTTDQRDREIHRLGQYVGQSFLVLGGVAGLLLALGEHDHFWIANVLYLAFFLSAVVGSVARIVAYRRGFQEW